MCVCFLVNEYRHRGHQNYERNFCFRKGHQTLDSIIYSEPALEVLFRLEENGGLFQERARSMAVGLWGHPSRLVFSLMQRIRKGGVVARWHGETWCSDASYFKSADLNKGEA